MDEHDVLEFFQSRLDETDYRANSTSQSLDRMAPLILQIFEQRDEIEGILDLGCGYGGLTAAFADLLECENVHGIDIDSDRRAVAEERGVTTYELDLESDPFPFDDGDFDLVLSFGVLEHLRYYDHLIEESNRVLPDDGVILYSVPNLGSWVNRIALLFGNQPRDVEISNHRAFGISEFYSDQTFLNHVHSPTLDAFLELLEYHGYEVDDVVGLFPYQERWFVRAVDRITAFRPSLCRRIAVLGRKKRSSRTSDSTR